MAILLPSMLLTMRRLWRDWTYLYGHTRLYPSKGAAASEQRSEQRCQLLARVRARASEKRPQNPTYLVHSTRLGSSIFARARSVILLRHSPTIIITNGQQRQRAEAAGRDGGSRGNKMQLVREKIDDVVVRAPAPAKATVGHTHTYTLPHTHTYIHKYFATLTHTHTCTPVCSVNTEIICVIKKPRTVSAPAPALASSLTIALSLSLLTGVYFWRFVAWTESPESMHPSRSISIITGLSPHPRPRTRPHIFHLCVCVWAQLRFEGYRI